VFDAHEVLTACLFVKPQATFSICLLLFVEQFAFPVAAAKAVSTAQSKHAHLFRVIASVEELEDFKHLESLQCSWEFASYAAAYSTAHGCRLESKMKPKNNYTQTQDQVQIKRFLSQSLFYAAGTLLALNTFVPRRGM
jgi:hypothetical protein